MPWFSRIKKQQAGDVIEARTIRQTTESAEWASNIRANPPLSVIATASGPLLRLAGTLFGAYIGVADGTITARSSGTPGNGLFYPQTWNGTALANLSTVSVPCLSISSTTGGIPTGTYLVVLKIYGIYWVITADCGN